MDHVRQRNGERCGRLPPLGLGERSDSAILLRYLVRCLGMLSSPPSCLSLIFRKLDRTEASRPRGTMPRLIVRKASPSTRALRSRQPPSSRASQPLSGPSSPVFYSKLARALPWAVSSDVKVMALWRSSLALAHLRQELSACSSHPRRDGQGSTLLSEGYLSRDTGWISLY